MLAHERIAELELRCEEYRILDETSDAVPFRLQTDLERFVYVGPQAESLLGIARDSWLAPGFVAARLSPEDRVATLEQFRLVVEFGAAHEVEFRFLRDDGTWIWLRCAMRMFTPSTGPVLAGHLMDITVRRNLASDQAQCQKLEAIGRLAAGIAHEMNTPLQFIRDNVEFIRDAVTDLLAAADRRESPDDLPYLAAELPRALGSASEGLARVAQLVRSMREFAHPGSDRKVLADINRGLESTLVVSAHEYRRVADVETALQPLPKVACYPSELNQVFLNLIVNAAHAIADTSTRGTIRVATRVEGGHVVVAISDTGPGIPAHIRERVFDPFFTTKDVGRGTGQGLTIARTIVEKHGGSLSFETAIGTGTTFFVRLPLD